MTTKQPPFSPTPSLPPAVMQTLREAMAAHQSGRIFEAENLYRRVLEVDDRQFPVLVMFGILNAQQGKFHDAERLLHDALSINPADAGVQFNYGNVLLQLQRFDEAFTTFGEALALNPDLAEAHLNRGGILISQKRFNEAIACFDAALAINPNFPEAHCNRGNAFEELRQFDLALSSYAAALALSPKNAEFHGNRANVLYRLKRHEEALVGLSTALSLQPANASLHYNKANILFELRRFGEAEEAYAKTLELEPDLEFAASARLQAKLYQYDWKDFEAECAHLVSSIQRGVLVQPFGLLAIDGSPRVQLKAARGVSEAKFPAKAPQWRAEKFNHDRIRLAYLSANFGNHAVSNLLAGVFEQHDRTRFDVVGLSFEAHHPGEMQIRLDAAFERFEDVHGRSDDEVAQMMRSLEIDIAVDLMGYTRGARTSIFALRPSAIQVNYLGFPGTMGASYMDYVIADAFVVPEACRQFYYEKIVYLPDVFQANDFKRKIDDAPASRKECGLPEDAFVFCSFSNSYKVNPICFDIWMRILSKIAGSVIWILGGDSVQENNLRREAENRGVDPRRLVFCSRTTYSKYLARYRLADLFLDTFPFNAGTTASDALWAGLPVITFSGQTFASRMAGSLLRSLGLPELVTESLTDYEALALKIALDRASLKRFKDKVALNRTVYPLFDTARFTRHIEAAYKGMVDRHRKGLAPETFSVESIG